VYPALAAVQSLTRLCADTNTSLQLLWVGSLGGMEQELVERANLKIELIPAVGLRGKNPVAMARGVWTLSRGTQHSRRVIKEFQPDLLFVTGGYVCVPVTLAAASLKVPVMIYLPDIEPGLAIKFLARFARRVAVTTLQSGQFFKPDQAVVTGYPVRNDLVTLAQEVDHRLTARRSLGLAEERPVLLIFGGSRGARTINQAIVDNLPDYLAVAQLVHITGSLDFEWVQAARADLASSLQADYQVRAYLHNDMIPALLAADLVVSRAGASVMGEFPVAGLPAVLVPYPYAGSHQVLNARYLAEQHAAVIVDDADLLKDLKQTVLGILQDETKLTAMRAASLKIAVPEAADQLARQIVEVQTYGN
jgi:UDP-N-acetylglucosamine--N-acetylmuramyl-(pentapeptide) pyrophosphoryl-undecaprenol N-acetylglucosamine transferase